MYLVGMAKGSEGNDLGCLPAALSKILHIPYIEAESRLPYGLGRRL